MNERGGRDADDGQEPRSLDDWLRPFFSEPTLWPVTSVLLIALGVFGAALLLLALGDRNVYAMAALAIALVATGDAVVRQLRRGRLGMLGGLLLSFWGVSAGLALVGARAGVF